MQSCSCQGDFGDHRFRSRFELVISGASPAGRGAARMLNLGNLNLRDIILSTVTLKFL